MPQFTHRDEPLRDGVFLESAIKEFLTLTVDRKANFWWPGLTAWIRPQVDRRLPDGRIVTALNIADLAMFPLKEDPPGLDWATQRWEKFIDAFQRSHAEDEPRNFLLVNGYMPLHVAKALRETPGCIELTCGRDVEFLLEWRFPDDELG